MIELIDMMLDNCGIDECDRTEIHEQEFLTGTYYNLKIYNPSIEDFFRLGSMLGEEFGDKNVWIDTYLPTPKYRGYAKIEIKK